MSHYFISDNNLDDNEYRFEYTFKGKNLTFTSNNGVFSKKRVDYGTNILINALDDLSNKKILDVGSGIGIIGICLASGYPTSSITMCDVNTNAVVLSNNNIKINNIKNATAIVSNLYENIIDKYDAIVSNPPIRAGKKVVHGVVKDGYNYLNDNGAIYVVIQKKQGAESMKNVLIETYGNCIELEKKSGYIIYKSVKRSL